MLEATTLDQAADFTFAELEKAGGDPASLPEPLKTVAVICSVQCLIDNGAFEFLFESDFPFQPA